MITKLQSLKFSYVTGAIGSMTFCIKYPYVQNARYKDIKIHISTMEQHIELKYEPKSSIFEAENYQ